MNVVPVWTWPVAVCVAAWLFRRWAVGALGEHGWLAVSRCRLAGTRRANTQPFRIHMANTPLAKTPPANTPLAEKTMLGTLSGNPGDGFETLAGRLRRYWKDWVGNWAGGVDKHPEPVAVLARKAVGPQQQVLMLRAGDREYTVFLQSAGPALLLSSRATRIVGTGSAVTENRITANPATGNPATRNRAAGHTGLRRGFAAPRMTAASRARRRQGVSQ